MFSAFRVWREERENKKKWGPADDVGNVQLMQQVLGSLVVCLRAYCISQVRVGYFFYSVISF